MKKTINKPVKGHPNFIIDSEGKVFNKTTNKRMEEYINPCGFSYVILDGRWLTIAYLMKSAFFDDDDNMCIRHKDGDRTNNKLSNLYTWFDGEITLNEDGSEKKIIIMEVDPKTNDVIRFWGSYGEIAEEIGVTANQVRYAISHQKEIKGHKYDQYNGGNEDIGLFDYTDRKHKVKAYDEGGNLVGTADSVIKIAEITGESSATVTLALRDRRRTKNGYLYEWELSTNIIDDEETDEEEQPDSKGRARAVDCYTRKGQYITTYDSVREAYEVTGVTEANIRQCTNGNSTHAGGYVWRWSGDPLYKYAIKRPSNEILKEEKPKRDPSTYKRDTVSTVGNKVCQYDNEGNLIKVWESASTAAKELHINLAQLGRAAKGKVKTAGGYYWSYEGQPFNTHKRTVKNETAKRPLYQLRKAPDGNGFIVVNEWDGVREAARELGYPQSTLAAYAKKRADKPYKDGYYYAYYTY